MPKEKYKIPIIWPCPADYSIKVQNLADFEISEDLDRFMDSKNFLHELVQTAGRIFFITGWSKITAKFCQNHVLSWDYWQKFVKTIDCHEFPGESFESPKADLKSRRKWIRPSKPASVVENLHWFGNLLKFSAYPTFVWAENLTLNSPSFSLC